MQKYAHVSRDGQLLSDKISDANISSGDTFAPVISVSPDVVASLTDCLTENELRCASWGSIYLAQFRQGGAELVVHENPILRVNIVGLYKRAIVLEEFTFSRVD